MIDMIVNQRSFGFADSLLHSMKLLREIKAGPPLTEHFDHPTQMSLRTPQSLDDFGVCFVNVIARHNVTLSPGRGYRKLNDWTATNFRD